MGKIPWEQKGFYNSELPPDPNEETEIIEEKEKEETAPKAPLPIPLWNSDGDEWEQDQLLAEDEWNEFSS